MKTESLMNDQEIEDSLVKYAWEKSREDILTQTKYAIISELSSRGNSRARALVRDEIDKVLKPRLESLSSTIEEGVQRTMDRIQSRMEERVKESLRYAINDICEQITRNVLNQASHRIRKAMTEALDEDNNEERP